MTNPSSSWPGHPPAVFDTDAQLLRASIDAGIARRAIDEAIAFLRDHARPWAGSGKTHASDDPFILREIADLEIKLHAAEAVVTRARRMIEQSLADATENRVARAYIAVAEARVLTSEIATQAGSKLFEFTSKRPDGNDSHAAAMDDPVRWKFHAIGNYVVNGIKPPRRSRVVGS